MADEPATSGRDDARAIARLRHVLASITEGFFSVDREYRFVEVNEAARRVLFQDKPDAELLGRMFWEVFPQGRTSEFYRQYHLAMETGREVHFEARSLIVPRWFETHAYPHEGGIDVYVRDVTDRKHAEEALAASEREFRAMFELATVGAVQADPATRRILRANRRFCEIVGYAEEELVGVSFLDITHPDDRARSEEVTGPVLRGERDAWESEKRYVRSDGSVVWAIVAGRLIRDAEGRPYRTIATVIDMTARREVEERLRESDRRKDEFIATLAHELRNPLAPIANAMHLLREQGGAADAGGAVAIYDVIDRQLQQLTRLVDDLLDVSRITRGKIELRRARIDLAAALERAIETCRPSIDAARHRLAVELPPEPIHVDGDLARIAQVVANLLHNAAKYNPRGGHILLRLAREGGEGVIRVRDDGIGLAPEHLSRIFEPFAQVDYDPDRAQGGLGIGLAIVRRLTEMHGGSVEAKSDGLGRGSEFVVRLPVASAAEAEAVAGSARAEAPARGVRVLIVDDNTDSADTLGLVLAGKGHEVRVVYDGFAALEAARVTPPDVVLLDLGMPGMSGFDVARELRANPATAKAYLVATTGWGQAADRRNTRRAGFDQHMVKPLDIGAIAALLAARGRG